MKKRITIVMELEVTEDAVKHIGQKNISRGIDAEVDVFVRTDFVEILQDNQDIYGCKTSGTYKIEDI